MTSFVRLIDRYQQVLLGPDLQVVLLTVQKSLLVLAVAQFRLKLALGLRFPNTILS